MNLQLNCGKYLLQLNLNGCALNPMNFFFMQKHYETQSKLLLLLKNSMKALKQNKNLHATFCFRRTVTKLTEKRKKNTKCDQSGK